MIRSLAKWSIDTRVGGMVFVSCLTALIGLELGAILLLPLGAALLMQQWRVTLFEQILPLDARTAFRSRMVAAAYLVVPPVAVWLIGSQLWWDDEIPAITYAVVISVVATWIAVGFVLSPSTMQMPRRSTLVLLFLATAAVAVGAERFLPPLPALVVLVLMPVFTHAMAWIRVPEVYGPDKNAPANRLRMPAKPSWLSGWFMPLVRVQFTRQAAIMLGIVALMSSVGPSLGFFYLFILAVTPARTSWPFMLPLSHRARFNLSLLPFLAGLLLFIVGNAASSPFLTYRNALRNGSPELDANWNSAEQRSRVPLAFWQRAAEPAPTIVAPWGETAAPHSMKLFGQTWYNPYSATSENSDRFVDWQFRNATRVVYGMEMSYAQYEALDEIPPRVTSAWPMKIFCVALGALISLLVIRASLADRIRGLRWFHKLPATLLYFALLAFMVLPTFMYPDAGNDIGFAVVMHFLLKLPPVFTQNLFAVTLVAVGLVVPAYLLAERRFRLVEAAGAPPTFADSMGQILRQQARSKKS